MLYTRWEINFLILHEIRASSSYQRIDVVSETHAHLMLETF